MMLPFETLTAYLGNFFIELGDDWWKPLAVAEVLGCSQCA